MKGEPSMKLSKNEFCNAVDTYKQMLKEENDFLNLLNANPEWKPGEWIENYYKLLTDLCELEEHPTWGTILDWFCYDTDFGRRTDWCKINDNKGLTWTVETPDILYDFIMETEN